MKKMTTQTRGLTKIVFAVLVTMLVLPSLSSAEEIAPGYDLSGQMRWRVEFDDRDFVSSTPLIETSFLRTRINLSITSIEKTTVFFQMQDSRNLGLNSAGLGNDTNLGVHQGYIKLDNPCGKGMTFQVGRFEAVYGRHRLMGNVGWSNVGRSFDGIRLGHAGKSYKADIFALKVVERGFANNHADRNLYGVYSTFMEDRLDVFVLYDLDWMKTGDDYNLARYTIGGYYKNKLESGLGYEFDAALQTGKRAATDLSAYMVAGDIYYDMDSKLSKVGFGFDVTSGDDTSTTDKYEAFDNLYYTGHRFRGYMDYFGGPNIDQGGRDDGLMDIILRGEVSPREKCTILIDLHFFRTMQDHADASDATSESKAVGQEIDITFKRKIADGIGCQSGLSVFLASDEFIFEADNAYWAYLMLTASF